MPAGRHGTAAVIKGGHTYLAAGSLKPGAGAVTDQLIVFPMAYQVAEKSLWESFDGAQDERRI